MDQQTVLFSNKSLMAMILGEFWIASRIIGPAQIFLAVGSQQIAFHRVPDG